MKLLFISFEEGFLISLIALIFFGPKKIPEISRDIGSFIRKTKDIIENIKIELLKNNIDKSIKKNVKKINDNLSKSIKR